MKQSLITYSTALLLICFLNVEVIAQQDSTSLKQEVEVVKAYQPSISDAFKINDIPQIKDNKKDKPNFNYQIKPQAVFSTFELEPVQAAQMVGDAKAELGKGLLKAGIGNYQTPYAEIFYNTKTGKNSVFGMHFKHLSSNGSIKLINEDKVDAPHSENIAELFANYNFRKSTLSTKLFFNRQAHRYYGYPGEEFSDSYKESLYQFWNTKQSFSKAGIQVQLTNDRIARSALNYNSNLYYHHFNSKTGQTENLVKIDTKLKQNFDRFKGQLDASISYLHTDSIINETSLNFEFKQQIIIALSPSIILETDDAKLKIGLNSFTLFDDDSDLRLLITPNIKASWSPVQNTMTLFAAVNGKLQQNHYSAIAAENRFVTPFQNIRNTEYQYILTGGIKGKFTPRFNYRFQVDYANIKDQHFYVYNTAYYLFGETIDTAILPHQNTFDALYDDLKQLTFSTELYYSASEALNFHMIMNHYSYQLENLDTPWHKPNFDANISTIFKPEGPLTFNVDIFLIGKKEAVVQNEFYNLSSNSTTPYHVDKTTYELSSVVDLNLGIEYQYSHQISFWGRLNNFAFQKYENWLGYSQQGFNVLLGASYSF